MTQIVLSKCEDGAIWSTSDEDQNGSESIFSGIDDEEHQFMIALADFLMLTPADVVNIGYEWQAMEEDTE